MTSYAVWLPGVVPGSAMLAIVGDSGLAPKVDDSFEHAEKVTVEVQYADRTLCLEVLNPAGNVELGAVPVGGEDDLLLPGDRIPRGPSHFEVSLAVRALPTEAFPGEAVRLTVTEGRPDA